MKYLCGIDESELGIIVLSATENKRPQKPKGLNTINKVIKTVSSLDAPCNSRMKDIEVIRTYLGSQHSVCFSLIYNRYAGKIYSKCISLLKDEALAQDATQEIFTKIFMNLSKFAERSKFSTWVYSITYNYCIDFLRRRKKYKDLFMEEPERTPDIPDNDVPDQELLEMEVKQLKKVLEEIPVDDKAILLMKYQDDMSIKEIAEILGKTESAVKMRIKRAKAKAQHFRNKLFDKDGRSIYKKKAY